MNRMSLALVAASSLAACGDGAPSGNQAIAAPKAVGKEAQAIIDMNKGQREGVLYRAIIDGKTATCSSVVDSAREADTEGQPTWSARCAEGTTYVVVVGPDGIAKVTGVKQQRS